MISSGHKHEEKGKLKIFLLKRKLKPLCQHKPAHIFFAFTFVFVFFPSRPGHICRWISSVVWVCNWSKAFECLYQTEPEFGHWIIRYGKVMECEYDGTSHLCIVRGQALAWHASNSRTKETLPFNKSGWQLRIIKILYELSIGKDILLHLKKSFCFKTTRNISR